VDGGERAAELAAMLGGVSEASLATAAEMLANARQGASAQ
jgi:hypothetical protein